MVASTSYSALYSGATAGEGSNNIVVYMPSLSTSITPDLLTIENAPTTTDTFDYKISVQGSAGSADAFSKSLLFAVDGNQTNATGISGTDVRFVGNFNAIRATNFFTYFSSTSDLSTTYILPGDSIFPSGKNANVTMGTEYVALIAYLFSGSPLFTDAFNNSKLVREKIDGDTRNNGSIINAIDAKFHSITEATLSNYSAITSTSSTLLGAKAALIAFEAITTYAEDRLNNTGSDGSIALTQASASDFLPSNVGSNENVYKMPFFAGDIIQFAITLNIPPTQFTLTPPTVTPNSTVSRTLYKVLVDYVLA